jgi:hypothetical protein
MIETAAPIDAAPLRSQHRVRFSLIWESKNESTARPVGMTQAIFCKLYPKLLV